MFPLMALMCTDYNSNHSLVHVCVHQHCVQLLSVLCGGFYGFLCDFFRSVCVCVPV